MEKYEKPIMDVVEMDSSIVTYESDELPIMP